LILLLLLAVLPIQITWSAGISHCPHDDGHDHSAGVPDTASHAADGHEHGHDDGDAGHGAGTRLHCGVFQFVALEPPAAPARPLHRAGLAVPADEHLGYTSHIPDGLDRPNWRLAA
jgi:hypothetical protein